LREKIGAWFGEEKSRLAGSAGQMRSLRNQTLCAMLLALTIVLDYFGSIYILPTVKISLSYIGIALTGALLGPVPAMINGALSDVLVWVIKPVGAYFPGYTLTAALSGMWYGMVLYKHPEISWKRAAAAIIPVILLGELLLNSIWVYMMYAKTFWANFPIRVLTNVIECPLKILLLMGMTKIVARVPKQLFKA